MPTVTVITGYYNRAPVLARTLDSIVNQSFQDFEFIVVDDASTDDTWARLQELAARYQDPRLVIKRNETNKGFTRTMIDAIAESTGTYIAVQGSGDLSAPTRLAKQVAVLKARPEVTAVGCYYTNIVENTGVRRPRYPNADAVDFAALLRWNVFSHGEVMIRRTSYNTAGGYRPAFVYALDYDLFLRLIKIGPFATVHEQLYERYVTFDGVSYVPKKFQRQARLSILARQLATLSEAEQAAILADFTDERLDTLVPLTSPTFQTYVTRAAVRALFWRNPDLARELVRDYSHPSWRAQGLRVLVATLSSAAGSRLLNVLHRFLGITSS